MADQGFKKGAGQAAWRPAAGLVWGFVWAVILPREEIAEV